MHGKGLYLLDATAFCYRAFYAIKGLSTSSGEPTNAVYGFVNILNKILKEEKPEFIAACFDVSRDTFRSRKFAQYKINRPKMSDELSSQIPVIKEIISAYGIPIIEREGFEADDIIAYLALSNASLKLKVTIISSDKDILQLVGKNVRVLNPYKDGGIIYNEEKVFSLFGVKPEGIADILSLMGDSSDNIPGIPGIGEKNASELVREFGSAENIIKNLDKVKKEKIRQSIAENKERIILNKELVKLSPDIDLGVSLEDLRIKGPDIERLAGLFKRLEFNKFLSELKFSDNKESVINIKLCDEEELGRAVKSKRELILYLEESGKIYFSCNGVYLFAEEFSAVLLKLLADDSVKKTGHDLKRIKTFLAKKGVNTKGFSFDIMIAGYLLNPSQLDFNIDSLALKYLDKLPNAKGLSTLESIIFIRELREILEIELKDKGLWELFNNTEMPLSEVLAEMELCGITLDSKLLTGLSREVGKKALKLEEEIYAISGSNFNINSPKQLRVILFDKLKLPVLKKTKTGPSTDEEVLNKLASKHRLPALLLEYRQLVKLKTTYIDALPKLIDKDTGKVHTVFNQCVTETGRLSSSSPNLQNIPIKTEIGSKIRKAIISSGKNNLLVSCDYSQIELRILAHLSKDESLTKAFYEKGDIHKTTASFIYSVKEEEVTPQMRDSAKRVNFGIIYGLTSFGLSRDLNIPVDEAQVFIDAYFLRYPRVKEYIESQIKKAQQEGFVTTILGRRRYLPEIKSKNMAVRQFAQRQAVNTPIQGSAADLIKLAMINIYHVIGDKKFDSKMILQIHDELLFDVPEREFALLAGLVKERMENVLALDVPVIVDIKKGRDWLDMSDYTV